LRRLSLRFRVRGMMVAVAIAGIVLAFTKYLFIDNRPFDILAATVAALDGHYTVYSKGYSESKFRSIRVGMTVLRDDDRLEKARDGKVQFNMHSPSQSVFSGIGQRAEVYRGIGGWLYARPRPRLPS
jgi:hypothetical protein